MAQDFGDVIFQPNKLNQQQTLGDCIVMMPKAGAIGLALTTVRVAGPGGQGVYNKYHKRMHTDSFQTRSGPWSPTNSI